MPGTSPGMTSLWNRCSLNEHQSRSGQAPTSHFFIKLFLAAPASGLPSALTALGAQASSLHFFMNEVFAAPARGLPSLPTALLVQVSSARAEPAAKVATIVTRKIRFSMSVLPGPKFWRGIGAGIRRAIKRDRSPGEERSTLLHCALTGAGKTASLVQTADRPREDCDG